MVTPEKLVEKGIIKKLPKHGVKILNKGTLGKKLTLKGFTASKEAKKQIEKSGSKLSWVFKIVVTISIAC